MKISRVAAGLALPALVAATPLSAQAAPASAAVSGPASLEPHAEQVEADSALRRRGILFGIGGVGLIVLLLALLLDNDTNAEPQPGPPASP